MKEPVPRIPLDTPTLIPLLQSNAMALGALDPPVKHPLSLLTHLTSLPTPPPYKLPSGEILCPPRPSGIPPRKFVILGDCSGGTQNEHFRQMCQDASLLIHECTNSAIPELIQKSDRGMKVRKRELEQSLLKRQEKLEGPKTNESVRPAMPDHMKDGSDSGSRHVREAAKRTEVRRKALSRGHSTPDEVGEFARSIRARRVVVNHFSAM